jgi:hypothetical protein
MNTQLLTRRLNVPIAARFAFCLAALLPARVVRADDDNNLKVDVVVDMTDEGEKITRPTPAHPAYYYPVVRGYTQAGDVVAGEKTPPPTPEVWRLIGKTLAEQGYQMGSKVSPPSLLLMFWWGYKAPIFVGASSGGAGSTNSGAGGAPGGNNVERMLQAGVMPSNVMVNGNEMEQLVFGSNHDRNTYSANPTTRMDSLNFESRIPRYYVTISALDFAAATQQKKLVVLWTAYMSTGLTGHTLDQVLPSLIAAGAPMWGRDTDGAQWPLKEVPIVPMGHVVVGTPYVNAPGSTPAAAQK